MASRIPEKFIDDLLMRVDIVELIDSRLSLKKAGKDYKACCPFHEEKTPSFTVSQEKQFYHCFGCGEHGSAIGFLMQYEHMPFPEAVEYLAATVNLPLPESSGTFNKDSDKSASLYDILNQANHFFQKQLREHQTAAEAVAYLKSRGLSGEVTAALGIGFAPAGWDNLVKALGQSESALHLLEQAGLIVKKDSGRQYDRFRHRIMFPIHDNRGRVVGFGGRVIADEEPKYLNSPESPVFHKGNEIYGLYHARDGIRRARQLIVVEGYMDVAALKLFAIDNAVATLGTATTREHIEKLFRFAPDIVFCFDGDQAGRDAAWRALEQTLSVLREGRQVSFLFLPDGEDPDSILQNEGKQAFTDRLNQAMPLPDYLFQNLQAKTDITRLDGRARLAEMARPLINKLPDGVLRQLIIERLAEISKISVDKLNHLLISSNLAPSKPAAVRYRGGIKQPPSLLRQVVALLVHKPSLALTVDCPQSLRALEMPGIGLFFEIIDLIKAHPDISNLAMVLERFRDTDHFTVLQRLSQWDYPRQQENSESEFIDAIHGLYRLWIKQCTNRLINKQQAEGLNGEEKQDLKRLLAEMHSRPGADSEADNHVKT